jgi:integrase
LAAEAFAERKGRVSPQAFITDEQRGRTLVEWFGNVPAAKITAGMIGERLQGMRANGVSGPTANRYRALLSAIFAWGVRNGKVTENPARATEAYREHDPVVRFLDADEEEAIRRVLRERYPEHEAEFDVALNTGVRRNELYRMTWDQVDLERRIVTVFGKAHARSKASRRRFIPLNPAAVAAFQALHERAVDSKYVCDGTHHGMETDVDCRTWFELAVERAGVVNFRYHDLRHTFASRLVMAGIPLAAVMELLGHRSIAMTMRYAHLAPDHQRANVERLMQFAAPEKGAGEVVKMPAVGGCKRR